MMRKELILPVGVAATLTMALIGMGVAWGEMDTTVEDHERRITIQEAAAGKVNDLAVEQGKLATEVASLAREQNYFREETARSLDRILDKLDRMGDQP